MSLHRKGSRSKSSSHQKRQKGSDLESPLHSAVLPSKNQSLGFRVVKSTRIPPSEGLNWSYRWQLTDLNQLNLNFVPHDGGERRTIQLGKQYFTIVRYNLKQDRKRNPCIHTFEKHGHGCKSITFTYMSDASGRESPHDFLKYNDVVYADVGGKQKIWEISGYDITIAEVQKNLVEYFKVRRLARVMFNKEEKSMAAKKKAKRLSKKQMRLENLKP